MQRGIAIGFVLLAVWGCDRPRAPSTATGTATANATASPAPSTVPTQALALIPPPTSQPDEPADNAPDGCVMTINQQAVEFPPARLRIEDKDGKIVAFLYSDDPKDALNNDYRGNGFYLRMPLDVSSAQFDRATWSCQSQSSERVDTPYGIFLDGHRRQLQPMDVRVRLRPAISGGVKVELAGTFLSVDPLDELAATQVVPVAAWLLAEKR